MNIATAPLRSVAELKTAWRELKAAKPIRIRDAATRLGVSEAELLACSEGEGVVRLGGDLREIVRRAPSLGPVMALTRNHACVHERDGRYEKVEADGMVGLVLGPDIDLRLFFAHWKHGFAVTDETPRGTLRSLQVFDGFGDAVHKLYLREESDLGAYATIVEALADRDPPPLAVQPAPPRADETPDDAIDIEAFRAGWRGLQDTHEFFGLLRRHAVARTQALRLAPEDHVRDAGPDTATRLLEAAAADAVPIMVFVGSRGCIQIHSGPVARVRPLDKWINVLDPAFNLHLDTSAVARAYVVLKPTVDGVVTSVELYDAAGELVVQFFGERKPGRPERPDWRALVDRLFPAAGA